MTVLLAAMVVEGATIFEIWVPGITRVTMAVEALVIGYYLVRSAVTGRLELAAAALAILGLLFAETVWFALLAHVTPNFNLIFNYLPLVAFVAFASYENGLDDLLHILVALSAGYLAIYVGAHELILQSAAGSSHAILADDGGRGDRVYLALPLASFVAFYALEARGTATLTRLVLAALALTALWLSASRTFQLMFVLVFLLAAIGMLTRLSRVALFAIFTAAMIALLAGFALPEWNPFALMAWDSSATVRAQEYHVAITATRAHWLSGIGLASDSGDLQQFLHTPRYEPLFPTDIGPMGPLLLLGVPGLLVFTGIVWFCMAPGRRLTGSGAVRALRLNGVVCGFYGIISPTLMLESNAIFLSLLIAHRLRGSPGGSSGRTGLTSTTPRAQLGGEGVA